MYDLERYDKGEADFIVGEKDQKVKLTYRVRLIGRDREFRKVVNLFDRARNSAGQICLVTGEPGIGKSRLVEEIRSYVYEKGGQFFSGRCFDQVNKIPYQPFRDIIDEHIRRLKRKGADFLKEEQARTVELLGDLRGLLGRLSPAMSELLEDAPPLVPLEPEKENKRFIIVCSKFFQNLTKENIPYVIFIDDLQWADEGTIAFLEELAGNIENSNILVLVTCRDTQMVSSPYLSLLKKNSSEQNWPFSEIKLDLFNFERMSKLAAELLGEREENISKLTRFLMEKTKGNPFFAMAILRELVQKEVLVWESGSWCEHWDKAEKLPVSANIIEAILLNINELSFEHKELFKIAALIGKEFEIEPLYELVKLDKVKIVNLIDDAIEKQLLEKSPQKGRLIFVHDEIRDAFTSKINIEERKALHLRIGEVLEAKYAGREQEVIFELAHHFIEAEAKDKILKYIWAAAEKAKASYANDEAIKYYKVIIGILEKENRKGSDDWVKASKNCVEVYLTMGNHAEAIDICNKILPLKKTLFEKARVYRKIAAAYQKKGDWQNCEKSLASGLELLGVKLAITQKEANACILKGFIIYLFNSLFYRFLIGRKYKHVKPEYKEIIAFYMVASWNYVLSDVKKLVCSGLQSVNIALVKIGKSKELGFALAAVAGIPGALGKFDWGIRLLTKSKLIREELNDEWGVAESLQVIGFLQEWKGQYCLAIKNFESSRDKYQKIGDIWKLSMTMQGLSHTYYYQADYKTFIEVNSYFLSLANKIKDRYSISDAKGWFSLAYTETGDFVKAEEFGKESFNISQQDNIWFIACFSSMNLGFLELERKNFAKAISYLEKAKKIYDENTFLKNYTNHLFPLLADAYIESFKYVNYGLCHKDRALELKRIKISCKQALKNNKSWPNHYANSLRVCAKYFDLIGRKRKAEKYFSLSLEQSKKLGKRFDLVKCGFEYGNFLESLGQVDKAKHYWNRAYTTAVEIQAKEYIKRLADLLGYKIDKESLLSQDTPRDRLKLMREMTTVMDSSRYISSILNLDELLEKVVDKAMEMVGAERGLLLLYPEDEAKDKKLEVRTTRNFSANDIENEIYSTSKQLIEKVERNKNPLLIEDATADGGLKDKDSVVKYGLRSVLCMPIKAKENMLGVLYLDNRLVSGLYTEDDLKVLGLIMLQAGISIENAILYKKAITDSLSGLYNHNFFENYLSKAVNQAVRYNRKLSLLAIDVDHFKIVNDTYGHLIGDFVLKNVSNLFKVTARKSDIVARYGGDEFFIILPETEILGAQAAGEKIRSAISNNQLFIDINGEKIQLRITVSVGVAEFSATQNNLELIECADKALYKAKAGGRNKVELASVN